MIWLSLCSVRWITGEEGGEEERVGKKRRGTRSKEGSGMYGRRVDKAEGCGGWETDEMGERSE